MKTWLHWGLKIIVLSLITHQAHSTTPNYFDELNKQKMVEDLQVIKHVFDVSYAPKEWKKKHIGWELEESFYRYKQEILNGEKLSTKEFQKLLRKFLSEIQDFHVNIEFISTESSSLPFNVRSVDGRYFVTWVDLKRLSPSIYSLNIGDELLLFDGVPVQKIIRELKELIGPHDNMDTVQALAELSLTARNGKRGDSVPKGPINITLKSILNNQPYSYQLIWNHQPEQIPSLFSQLRMPQGTYVFSGATKNFEDEVSLPGKRLTFFNPIGELYSRSNLKSKGGIGSRKSSLPYLGKVIWSQDDSLFPAYLYQHESGAKIGCVRIPHYRHRPESLFHFAEHIQFFQDHADILVIDQLDNPGGYVINQYLMASLLTDKPLFTPRHRLTISQQEISEAIEMLKMLETVQSDEEAQLLFGGLTHYTNFQFTLFLKEYYRFVISEWSLGHLLTNPIHIEGVDQINPNPYIQFNKPILVLINELDFSGGDFFPAIMQDNERAKMFGNRTAGAGGCVKNFEFPNIHGIQSFSYTVSFAERLEKQPIEDLGVWPEYLYKLSIADLQKGYKEYVETVNQILYELIFQAE